MNILIIGGDRLGKIPGWLERWSGGKVRHRDGYKNRRPLSSSVNLVIVAPMTTWPTISKSRCCMPGARLRDVEREIRGYLMGG